MFTLLGLLIASYLKLNVGRTPVGNAEKWHVDALAARFVTCPERRVQKPHPKQLGMKNKYPFARVECNHPTGGGNEWVGSS